MGNFNHVNFEMKCPKCGEEVKNFQSKDGSCYFETVEYWQCNNFYDACYYCNTWIEFTSTKEEPLNIDDYEMKLEELPNRDRILIRL